MNFKMVPSDWSAEINIARIASKLQLHLQLHGKEYMKTGLLLGATLMMFMITGCRKEPKPRPDAGTGIFGRCVGDNRIISGVSEADCRDLISGGRWSPE